MIKGYYIFVLFAVLILISIGLLIDRVGGIGIRTDDVASPVSLSFSQPLLPGVPLTIRWQGDMQDNLAVTMQLVAQDQTYAIGNGKLLSGSARVSIPCTVVPGEARLELLDTSTQGILAVSPVEVASPGPDCIR